MKKDCIIIKTSGNWKYRSTNNLTSSPFVLIFLKIK